MFFNGSDSSSLSPPTTPALQHNMTNPFPTSPFPSSPNTMASPQNILLENPLDTAAGGPLQARFSDDSWVSTHQEAFDPLEQMSVLDTPNSNGAFNPFGNHNNQDIPFSNNTLDQDTGISLFSMDNHNISMNNENLDIFSELSSSPTEKRF